MPAKTLKRLNVSAREFHVLLRETLLSLGFTDIYSSAGAGSFGLVSSGVDGETDSSFPTRFQSPTGAFTPALIGNYLAIGNSQFSNLGVHEIVGVPDSSTLLVRGGIYGSSFVTSLNSTWRIVDPTLNTDVTEWTFAGVGTTPAWQIRAYCNALDTDIIRFDVGPFGGYTPGLWTAPVCTSGSISEDATPYWFAWIEDSHLKIWTLDSVGTSVNEFGYFGSGQSRRPVNDQNFAVQMSGSVPSLLSNVESIASDDSTQITYEAIIYGDHVDDNRFSGLLNSEYDLRRDVAQITVGTDAPGFEEDDRGYLRGLYWVSDLLNYGEFVDNSRLILALGSGLAIAWDSTLGR